MKMDLITSLARKFAQSRAGNFATIFALLAPLMIGLLGGAADFMAFQRNEARLRDAADSAALAAAREGSLQGWTQTTAESVAAAYVDENLAHASAVAPMAMKVAASSSVGERYTTTTVVDPVNKTVSVTISMDFYPYFYLGYFRGSPQITVTSQANVTGEMNTCIIGLDGSASSTIKLSGTAKLTAPKCAVYSNSVATNGFEAVDNSLLTSDFNCSAGGYTGKPANYTTQPTTDCKPLDDPLAKRGIPAAAACNFTNKVVSGLITILSPGVYCGGITINKNANVLFKPGTYVIKDGELKSNLGGISAGKGVTFIFTGEGSRFAFDATTNIGFSAPETGPYAGILFYQDPAMVNMLTYEISSVKAGTLLGTIYLPNGIFKVHAANKIGEQSAYTVIVARQLDIGSAADLVINADYASTKVPVPDGVGPQGGGIRLTH